MIPLLFPPSAACCVRWQWQMCCRNDGGERTWKSWRYSARRSHSHLSRCCINNCTNDNREGCPWGVSGYKCFVSNSILFRGEIVNGIYLKYVQIVLEFCKIQSEFIDCYVGTIWYCSITCTYLIYGRVVFQYLVS